jgi:hypothetical protein
MSAEADLHQRMLRAHMEGEAGLLPALYLEAARLREAQGDTDAACFFYTHAYVYALDAGDEVIAGMARSSLKGHGRDR